MSAGGPRVGGLFGLALLGAALTASWNAVGFQGPIQPVDAFIGLALVGYLLTLQPATKVAWAPWWFHAGALAVLVVLLAHEFWPVAHHYMRSRYVSLGYGFFAEELNSNASAGIKLLIAMWLLPLLISERSRGNVEWLGRLAGAYVIGVCLSCIVAITDTVGVTAIGAQLLGYEVSSGRAIGLSNQPNHLAIACALALPVAVYFYGTRRRASLLAIGLILAGLLLTGSRGGQVVGVVALTLACVTLPAVRRRAAQLIGTLGAAAAVTVFALPDGAINADALLRFDSDQSTSARASDAIRAQLLQQGLRDWDHRSFDGIGLQAVSEAHSLYVQWVAAGGLILLLGMLCYFSGLLGSSLRDREGRGGLQRAWAIGIAAYLIGGLIENQISDRYLFFPVGCLLGYALHRRTASERRDRPDHATTLQRRHSVDGGAATRRVSADPDVHGPGRGCDVHLHVDGRPV